MRMTASGKGRQETFCPPAQETRRKCPSWPGSLLSIYTLRSGNSEANKLTYRGSLSVTVLGLRHKTQNLSRRNYS